MTTSMYNTNFSVSEHKDCQIFYELDDNETSRTNYGIPKSWLDIANMLQTSAIDAVSTAPEYVRAITRLRVPQQTCIPP